MAKISEKTKTELKQTAAHAEDGSRPFTGFGAGTFQFLRDLSENQTREWFQANKEVYEKYVREPMASLVIDLCRELRRRSIPMQGDPKRSIFRINRDIRFSVDKRPYKTHVSAAITREGEKLSPGVLYVHVDPQGSFAAAGFFRPEPDVLRAIRHRIAARPEDLRSVVKELTGHRLTLSEDEDALKRPPRGFESVKGSDLVDVLRRNSLIVRRPLSQKVLRDSGLIGTLAEFAEACLPLLDFGWAAISETVSSGSRAEGR